MKYGQRKNWLASCGLGILFFFVLVYSQPFRLQFRHITPDEGLSSSSVISILQDHKGYMWFGTYEGLDRYDGINFVHFKYNSADSTTIPHNLIWQIIEDRSQQLWIANGAGLSRYDWIKDHFVNYMTESSSPLNGIVCGVQNILEDSLGNLWLATTKGLIYFDLKNNRAVTYQHDPTDLTSLSNNYLENLLLDSKNRLWISTRNGLNLWKPESKTFERFKYDESVVGASLNAHFMDIAEDRSGNLWFASFGNGIFCLKQEDIKKKTMINYRYNPDDPYSLSGDRILTLFVDSKDRLWIGTENTGLNLWDDKKKIFWRYKEDVYNPSGLNNNSIHSIYEDRTGNFWIGTFAGGINVTKYNGNAIQHYKNLPGVTESLTNNSVRCFEQDHLGRIWIGTDGGGINLFKQETGRFRGFHSGNTNLNSDAVLSILEDSKYRMWIGTWAGGLNFFNTQTMTFKSFTTKNSGIPDDNIFQIKEDKKGRLWLSSFQSGLIEFIPEKNQFINYTPQNSGISHEMVQEVEFASNGCIYIGTSNGFNVFYPDEKRFITYFHDPDHANSVSNNYIYEILAENDSTVWIATQDGLNRFNPNNETFVRFYKKDGLPDNSIKACIFDDSGYLWLTSTNGVGRFNTQTLECKIFTKEDGMQSNEFYSRSALKTRDGRILLGGSKGFNVLYPDKIVENHCIPQVLLTDFYIFNKPVKIGTPDSPLQKHISEADQLTLSYKHTVFTFGFAVMDFTVPEKNRYAYRMEGFEKDWNEVGTQRTATYTNLSPGEYIFHIKGSNNDGYWNQDGTSIRVIITPPFWKTKWFQGISLILLIGLLFLGYNIRIKRMRKLNLELEEGIRERTAELEATNKELESFSYSVSHDLRAPLRSMNGFSEILLENYGDKIDSEGKKYLQRIRSASRRMGNLIDDILKLSRVSRGEMEINRVNLSALAESVMNEISQAYPKRQVEFHNVHDVYVQGDESLLKVLLWNLLDNAYKFTSKKSAPRIEFGVTKKKGSSVYFVRDNGIGLDKNFIHILFEPFQRQAPEYEGTGVGLATAKRIVLRHGGSIWAEGNINEGATFYFTIRRKI